MTLGDQVKDVVSGFSGIAMCRHIYMQGCNRISVQPKVDRDGKLPEAQTFDEPQLVIIKSSVVPAKDIPKDEKGGPDKYMPKDR